MFCYQQKTQDPHPKCDWGGAAEGVPLADLGVELVQTPLGCVLGKLPLALGVESSALGRPEEENMARICSGIITSLGDGKGPPNLGGHMN